MKLKVLVLGSYGLIGHQVYNYLESTKKFSLFDISYKNKLNNTTILCDIKDEVSFNIITKNISPDIIINCIGILITESNKNPENAIFVNSFIPHRLRRLSDSLNCKLIHMSTDCVFSGKKGTPYVENDLKDGIDLYAKSKGLGEIIDNHHLTIRTSVVGPEIKNGGEELFHWFMNQNDKIYGYLNSIWSGVSSLELAKAVNWAINNKITGLYHITNNDSINKNQLLNLFKKYSKKNIKIIPYDSKKINKSFVDTRKEINYTIPSYDIMIKELLDYIMSNKKLYHQYFENNNR